MNWDDMKAIYGPHYDRTDVSPVTIDSDIPHLPTGSPFCTLFSVDSFLPPAGVPVLVINEDGEAIVAKMTDDGRAWRYKYCNYDYDSWGNREQGTPKYWMPLPMLPRLDGKPND